MNSALTVADDGVAVARNWINGAAVDAAGGGWIDDLEPARGTLLARVARGGATDIDLAVQAARQALTGPWAGWSAHRRADLLDDVANRIERRTEEFARWESRNSGKALSTARNLDIPRAVANFRFFAGAARHDATACHPMAGALNYTLRRPLGVVGLISPWNLPLYLLSWKVAPALAMGNTVVAKPSELTPITATLLAEVLHEAGAPPGVMNVVHGLGPEAGEALCAHPDVAGISFTGGTATGRRVAGVAAPMFKKLSLELGGKNPTLVFADADWERALAGTVRAGFTNGGQICLCGSRVLVERSIYERFVEALVERVAALRVGDPNDPETEIGSLVSRSHREKVEGFLQSARDDGGTLRCGGDRPDLGPDLDRGAFLSPSVITGLTQGCRAVQEEIFGPVVTVQPFDTEDEALSLANGVRFGLSASLWTQDLGRAHRISAALDCGMVWVNTWLLRDLRVPFGGIKESGVGREGGAWSLDFYSEARNICVAI